MACGHVKVIQEKIEIEEFYDLEENEFQECREPTIECQSIDHHCH